MEGRKHLVDWLRDAHAMEKENETLLEKQVKRLENYPELKARIQQHLEITRSQAERVEGCISRLDGGSSMMKDMAGKMMANMGALFNAGTEDEVVKNTLGDYATEHFEIACYRSLIAAAEESGDQQTARVCREILQEEEQMAAWLADHIPSLTKMYMQRDRMEAPAKR